MRSRRDRWFGILTPALLLFLFLALRLPALGRFVTTDEALWLRRSANFYLALSNGEWNQTYQSPHPGVVTLWAGAAGFWLEFPEYSRVGFDPIHDSQLLTLMENRGINPMSVLAAGRMALVVVHATTFLATWPFARRLFGLPAAALGMALLALDPFTLAHQRLLHLDGLLASFMLLALLACLDFLREGRWQSLTISGIAAGFAWLTKTPMAPAIKNAGTRQRRTCSRAYQRLSWSDSMSALMNRSCPIGSQKSSRKAPIIQASGFHSDLMFTTPAFARLA